MIECRNCRAFLRQTPEQLGSRCPDCRMPLFERDDRPRRGEAPVSGYCDKHRSVQATAACERCQTKLCATCKTKWNEQTLCVDCQARSVQADEPHPRDIRSERFQGVLGFSMGVTAWICAIVAYGMLWTARPQGMSSALTWWSTLVLIAILPAIFAVGQGLSAALGRSTFRQWGLSGLILGSLHIGLTTGLFLLNFVRN